MIIYVPFIHATWNLLYGMVERCINASVLQSFDVPGTNSWSHWESHFSWWPPCRIYFCQWDACMIQWNEIHVHLWTDTSIYGWCWPALYHVAIQYHMKNHKAQHLAAFLDFTWISLADIIRFGQAKRATTKNMRKPAWLHVFKLRRRAFWPVVLKCISTIS